MVLFEAFGTEQHPLYREIEASNGSRQYSFLLSMVLAAVKSGQPWLSQQLLKALNYHAIACLHTNPGEFRPCEVHVGHYNPPMQHQVTALMEEFINRVNWNWRDADPVVLASYVLWRLNFIHPFINGNGRTARAACYFVLCVSSGGLLPGDKILPELLKENRDEYVAKLKEVDASYLGGNLDLAPLHAVVSRLLEDQVRGHMPPAPDPS